MKKILIESSHMRRTLQELGKAADDATRQTHLEELYWNLGTHATEAGQAGCTCVAKLGSATQGLIKELLDTPAKLTASTLRTTAQALDCLDELANAGVPADLAEVPPISVLIVDDEPLARRAVAVALEKAHLEAVAVETAAAALDKASTSSFDLICLDIHMPEMDGFLLCEKLRQTRWNSTTPVVFITSTADFQARAQSTLRGATDLIAKPFIFLELTVKALTYALRSRAEQFRQNAMLGDLSAAAATSNQEEAGL